MGQFFARILRRPRSRPPQDQEVDEPGDPGGGVGVEVLTWVTQSGDFVVTQSGDNIVFGVDEEA